MARSTSRPGAGTTPAAPTGAAGVAHKPARADRQRAATEIAEELHRADHVRNHTRLPILTQ